MEHKYKIQGKTRTYDLYRFARNILDYSKLQTNPHHAWCRELERHHKRSLWLEPRGTYKSTIFTKAYPIWRLFLNPNLRILILSATAANARAFLHEIVQQYETNKMLRELYHRCYGVEPLAMHAARTSSIVLTTRTRISSEPSIGTAGTYSSLVSRHYDLIIVDDLCNEQDRESPRIRWRKKQVLRDLVSVLDPNGELVIVGTHWHFDDLYSYIINELNPQLPEESQFYIQRESCYTDDGEPRFHTILPRGKLDELRIEKGLLLFACQYLNQPLPSEQQIFRLEAMHTVPKSTIKLEDAEVFAFCDPSLGVDDPSAIVTVLKQDHAWTVLHCDIGYWSHTQLIEKLIELQSRYKYRAVGIEANSLGKAKSDTEPCSFEIVLRERQSLAGVTVPYKLVWHGVPKAARIESVEPYYTNGQLQFLETWNQDYPELIDQLIQFPLAAHDDGPDALAGAVTLIQEYAKAQEAAKARAKVLYPRAR